MSKKKGNQNQPQFSRVHNVLNKHQEWYKPVILNLLHFSPKQLLKKSPIIVKTMFVFFLQGNF